MASSPLLAQLRDIHPPASVAWWPPAVGWWLLFAVGVLMVTGVWWWLHQQRKQRWNRDALAQLHQEIAQLRHDYQQSHNGSAACAVLSSLMRRVALQVFPEASIAGIHGKQWLQFLDEKELLAERFEDSEWGELLLHAPYSSAAVDPEDLIVYSQRWMEAAIQLSQSQHGSSSS